MIQEDKHELGWTHFKYFSEAKHSGFPATGLASCCVLLRVISNLLAFIPL